MAVRAILFDLDGTLVQTREASWELFEQTNREFALGIDSREAFFELFNDNFFRALEKRVTDRAKLVAAKQHFLGLLRTQYAPALVPGLADVVRVLASHFTLVVLSTNTMTTIRRILGEAGLAHCFAHVFAGDVEPDKSASMRRFIADAKYCLGRRCEPAYDERNGPADETGEIVLVTDTCGDVKEASACGVRAIGVAWGMHAESDLLAAGAETVAVWPQELIAWLAPGGSATRACAVSPNGVGSCACNTDAPPVHGASSNGAGLRDRVAAAARVRRARRNDGIFEMPAAPGSAVVSRAPPAYDRELLATLSLLHSAPKPTASSQRS